MSKLRTATTTTKDTAKKKSSVNSTTAPIARKSTSSVAAPNSLSSTKAAIKNSDTELRKKSSAALDERTVRPSGTKTSVQAQKAGLKVKSLASKSNQNQQISQLKKEPNKERISSPVVVRAKNTSSKVDLPQYRSTRNPKIIAKQSKPNAVLDTFHNVTVSSPPPLRRKIEPDDVNKNDGKDAEKSSTLVEKRIRTRTHTLDPDEVVVLRNESAKQRSEAAIEIQSTKTPLQRMPIKDAIAFEVSFEKTDKIDKTEKPPTRSRDTSRVRSTAVNSGEEIDANYSDDFESYESDFENGSSSPTVSTESDEDHQKEEEVDKESEPENIDVEDEEMNKSSHDEDDDDDEDESELTQYPITVIQRDKEFERKLDSGNYEIHSGKRGKSAELTPMQPQQFDSLDTFSTTNSEQLDSGISTYGNVEKKEQTYEVSYGGYTGFNARTQWTSRDVDLMSKIQFDTLNFTLFEMKPMSYDVFMQSYGKLNSTQSSTQTNENRMSTEMQTEDYEERSIWTQHPPQYDRKTVQKFSSILGPSTTQNCCGEFVDDSNSNSSTKLSLVTRKDQLDEALSNLQDFRQSFGNIHQNVHEKSQKSVDIERLHAFLLNSSAIMSRVLTLDRCSERYLDKQLHQPNEVFSKISRGYNRLNTNLLDALRVVRVFSNPRHSLIISVHESLPEADVYRSDFSNLLMVWSTSDCSKPIRLLSSWSEICRAEISNDTPDIVVCGLRDGTVAMWDLRETYSFCSKLDGYLTHFAATQSIVPTWNVRDDKMEQLVDMGAVIDIRSFRPRPKTIGLSNSLARYKSIQFASLNETGVLIIWTIVETTPNENTLEIVPMAKGSRKIRSPTPKTPNTRFEYSSPWARIKLIQSAICDIRTHLERCILKTQTTFDRTKFLFENNIYKDDVLRELNVTEMDSVHRARQPQVYLRCTCIDTGCDAVYVCTNRNFILICSKTLKAEKFRKISISEDRFLFPTALRVLTNEDFLAVGLSNGSVMILNCNSNALKGRRTTTAFENFQSKRDSLKRPTTQSAQDIDIETGKSCAIQNIILNEKRTSDYEYVKDYEAGQELRPTTAACIGLISNQKKPFELRIFDQQTILSGSMLRKDLVQSLEISSDGWRLFALSDGEIRTYDFYLDREMTSNATVSESDQNVDKQTDIAVAKTTQTLQHLIVLSRNNNVDIHNLSQ